MPEVTNAGSYARVTLGAPSNSLFTEISQDASSSGNIANAALISFPVATAAWGWVSGVAVTTSGVYGAGEIILGGALPTPKYIDVNDQYTLPINALTILLG